MKKSFLFLLFSLLLTGCGNEKPQDHTCLDEDKDGVCDICGKNFVPQETGIKIKKQPNKTKYYAGEVFDPTGMVVNLNYSDGTFVPVTEYTYSTEPLKLTDKAVTIHYGSFTTDVAVEVISKPSPEQEYTQTISLSGNDFSVVATNAGVQFDDASYSRNVELLKEYCDSCLEYKDLINSINCSNLNTCEWDEGAALCIGTGYYGNGKFKAGSFTWNSKVKIYKVEIEARAYTKKNNYSGDIVDTPAVIHLDEERLKLVANGDTTASLKTLSKEYDDGVNSFTISSTGARVAIKQIKITWRG